MAHSESLSGYSHLVTFCPTVTKSDRKTQTTLYYRAMFCLQPKSTPVFWPQWTFPKEYSWGKVGKITVVAIKDWRLWCRQQNLYVLSHFCTPHHRSRSCDQLWSNLSVTSLSHSSKLCESRGGRPGLAVLTSLMVSVDIKLYWTMLRHWSQLVPNMSSDIRGH